MKKQPVLIFALFLILICSSCNLMPAESSQTVTPLGQVNQTEVKLEKNDWSNIWIENANQSEKPRILFVGDSITEGYYPFIEVYLSQDFSLGYYVTSKFLGNPDYQTELTTTLDRYDFEIIHINNGLHGWDYSIQEYQKGLEDVKRILDDHAPNTLIIWCMTTPIRVEENLEYLDKLNQDVILRNQAALEILGENGVIINDLYQEMLKHPDYYRDGYHFNSAGKGFQAKVVAEFILAYH
jgi:hypothetical protein